MTETGARVLTALGDGEPWSVKALALEVRSCQRLTRAAAMGLAVGGLVKLLPTAPTTIQITEDGRQALAAVRG